MAACGTDRQQEQLAKSLDKLFDMNIPVDSWFTSEEYIQIYTYVYDICTFISPESISTTNTANNTTTPNPNPNNTTNIGPTSNSYQIDFGQVAWNVLYNTSCKHLMEWSNQLSTCPNPIDLYATFWNRYQNIIPHIEAIFLYLERHWIMRMINNHSSTSEFQESTIQNKNKNEKEMEQEREEKNKNNNINSNNDNNNGNRNDNNKVNNGSKSDKQTFSTESKERDNVTFTRILLFRLWYNILLNPNEPFLKSLMEQYLNQERRERMETRQQTEIKIKEGKEETASQKSFFSSPLTINPNMITIFKSYAILSTPVKSILRKHPIDSGIKVYYKSLEPWYINLLSNYCEELSNQMSVVQMNHIQGVRNLFTKWKEEINRANLYLGEKSKKLVKNTLKTKLLNPVIDGILVLYERYLINERDPREPLSDIYELFAQKKSLLKFLEEPTERAFIKRFDKYGTIPKSPNDTFVAFIEFLQHFKLFWDDSNDILRDALKMDEELMRRRDRTLSMILGEIGGNLAEYVARALDTLINQSENEEQFGEAQNAFADFLITIIFRHVMEKDRFQSWNIRLMARRLVRNGGRSLKKNAEELIIGYIKKACGSQYSQPLEKMINDVEMSKEATMEFHNHCHRLAPTTSTGKSKKTKGGIVETEATMEVESLPSSPLVMTSSIVDGNGNGNNSNNKNNNNNSSNIDNYQILTFGIWPFKPVESHHFLSSSPLSSPSQISNCLAGELKKFEEFYSKIHTGRVIRWLPNLSTVDLLFKGQYQITVNFYQYRILEYIESVSNNSSNGNMVTMDNVMQTFSSIPELTNHIESLFSSGLLTASPQDKDNKISISDTFNIPYLNLATNDVSPSGSSNILNMERSEANRSLALDRQTIIQAAIVRHMKMHRQCSRTTLINAIAMTGIGGGGDVNVITNDIGHGHDTTGNNGEFGINGTRMEIIAERGGIMIDNSDQIIQALDNLANREFIKIEDDVITYIA